MLSSNFKVNFIIIVHSGGKIQKRPGSDLSEFGTFLHFGFNHLLDGHNRLAICEELGKPFSVREIEFPDKNHAVLWVLKNQLGRRNLSDIQFKLMIGMEYELEKKVSYGGDRKSEAAKENQLPQSEGDDSPRETAERLAKEHNISRTAVERSAGLYKALKVIRDADPEFAQRIESERIKVSKKDIHTLGKALQHTPEQKERIISELENDPEKAIDIAEEVEAQYKPKSLSSEHEALIDECIGDTINNSVAPPTRSNADLDIFLMVADRMRCPKCGKEARLALRWSCCSLSLAEAAGLEQDGKNEHICPTDAPDDRIEVQSFENEEQTGTTSECHHNDPESYSKMVQWIPVDNSSQEISTIVRAFCSTLSRGEAPRVDSLAKMANLPSETVQTYLGSASWVRKCNSSPDGIAEYLPIEPSRAGSQVEGES